MYVEINKCQSTDGDNKREFFKNLGRLVVCDRCSFRPLNGSPLEPYLGQMLISMTESLVPLEILDSKEYELYYFKNIREHLRITETYKCGRNQIFKQLFYSLFCFMIGSLKTTRYMHILCFGSEYYYRQAYKLKTTPRALGGTDAIESFNSKVKHLVYTIAGRFCNEGRLPGHTIEIVMRYCMWEHLVGRENNNLLDTRAIQQKLYEKHKLIDKYQKDLPGTIRKYLNDHGIPCQIQLTSIDELEQPIISDISGKEIEDLEDTVINHEIDDEFINNLRMMLDGIPTQFEESTYYPLHSSVEMLKEFIHLDKVTYFRTNTKEEQSSRICIHQCSVKLGANDFILRMAFSLPPSRGGQMVFIRATQKWEFMRAIWYFCDGSGMYILLKSSRSFNLQYKKSHMSKYQKLTSHIAGTLTNSIRVCFEISLNRL